MTTTTNESDDRLSVLRAALHDRSLQLQSALTQLEAVTGQVRELQSWVASADVALEIEGRRAQKLRLLAKSLEQTLAGENVS